MLQNKDYEAYKLENKELIYNLSSSNSILYPSIKDCMEAMDFIIKYTEENTETEEFYYLEEFFEFLYDYFSETIDTINIFYEHYFNKDFFDFRHFEKLVDYYILINDVINSLQEQDYLNARRKNILVTLQNEIDELIKEHKDFTQEDLDGYDSIIQSCMPPAMKKFETARDFISRIREEIMIDCE